MTSFVEIDPVVLVKMNFVFSLFRNYLPLEKGRAHLNKLEFPSPKDALCQVWLKFPSGSGEEDKNVKSLREQRRQRQRRRIRDKAHLILRLK